MNPLVLMLIAQSARGLADAAVFNVLSESALECQGLLAMWVCYGPRRKGFEDPDRSLLLELPTDGAQAHAK